MTVATPRPTPRLRFSSTEEIKMRQLGHALETEVVELYEQFVFRHRRRIDTTRWKETKSFDHVTVYCERDEYRRTWRHKSKMKDPSGPMITMAASSSMPMAMVLGSIQGSLDDALYGSTFLDSMGLRVRNEYLDQKADDPALLAVIDAPYDEDPFQFLGVTYVTRAKASRLGRARQLLLLSGVRSSKLSTGERIGVAFHHSIEHPDLPSHRNGASAVRAQASSVTIYRQLDEGRLDVFIVDFCDLHGKVRSSTAMKQSVGLLIPRTGSSDAGVKKKLFWLMRERQRCKTVDRLHESVRSVSSRVSSLAEPRVDNDFCDICDSSLRGAGGALSSSCICQLCGEYVCSKCVVTKQIAIDAVGSSVETKPFAFCVACMHHVKSYPSSEIAKRELADLWSRSTHGSNRMYLKFSEGDCEQTRPTTLID